jgi:hypothetical protein
MTMTTVTQIVSETSSTPNATDGVQYRSAYEQTAPDRAGLAEEQLLPVNADVPSVVHIAIGAVRHIASLRSKMTDLPVDLALIDRVEAYAHATGYAHAVFVVATDPPADLQSVYESCIQARALLRSDASNLALHGIVNPEAITQLNGDTGHRNVGYDLLSLVAIHRAAKAASAGRTAVLEDTLIRAEEGASRLLDMVAKRETQLKEQADVVNQRRRAFTLLLNAYDEAQQAVAFLRWKQKDVEKFTPSLFATKGAGRPKSTKPLTSNEAAEAATGAAPNGPAPGTATAPAASGVHDAPAATPGTRGGNPFA